MSSTEHTRAMPKQAGLSQKHTPPGKPQRVRTVQRTRHGPLLAARLQAKQGQHHSGDKSFKLMTLRELAALPPAEWLVSGLIPEQGLACLYGAPGNGKSFLALDLALCVAAGKSWFGHQVKAGKVVYIAAEGSPANLYRRIEAWFEARKVDHSQAEESFLLLPAAVDLSSGVETGKLISSIQHSVGRAALLVVDTVARSFGTGDENSTRDMGLFVKNIDALRHALSATALLVHHSGKDSSKGARGSMALEGACDTMLKLSRADNVHTLQCQKQKDHEPFDPYKLMLIRQGEGAVLQLAAGRALNARLSGTQQLVIDALHAPVFRSQGATFGGLRATTEANEKTLSRALSNLCERGLVRADGAPKSPNRRYHLTAQGEAALTDYAMDTGTEMDKSMNGA